MMKWIGVVLVLTGCGSCGFGMAASYNRTAQAFRQLLRALEVMQWEMQYRLTALPELCEAAAGSCSGPVARVFAEIGRRLTESRGEDIRLCILQAVSKNSDLPESCGKLLFHLADTMGRYDLEGQLRGLQATEAACREALAAIEDGKEGRLRSYRALGLCGGAALALLLL